MELHENNYTQYDFDSENRVTIKIKKLRVWTPEEKSWWRRRPTKQKTIILNDVDVNIRLNTLCVAKCQRVFTGYKCLVTGRFKEGEFAAVIGPSGAGKTTFLIALAGKCTLPSEGTVTVNGVNVRDQQVVEIVPQFEVFMDSLSVMEHLIFMTEMKLGSCKNPLNRVTLSTLICKLKLKSHENMPICTLSGGERRLLSLATSLLSDPQILICDEPTTGLDSYNASVVIDVLKRLAATGKTVVCSIHQPSCDLYKEFSSILLMADGRLVFHGSQNECKSVFESINLHCPINYNPAEFYIRALSNANEKYIEKILETFHEQSIDETCSYTPIVGQGHLEVFQRNWFKQVQLLLWRSLLNLKRSIRNQLLQLLLSVVISSMILGTCYVGIKGTNQRGVQDIRGFLWLITSEISFSLSYNALYVFESEMALFKREIGIYKCSAYFVSRFLSFIPRCIVWPITLVAIATFAVELPNHVITALEFIVSLVAAAVASMAYGLGMAALFTSTGIMGDVMPCVDLPLFLMSGAFLRISSMPGWLYPVKFISHFYYAMDAISNIYWRQIDHIDCPWNSTTMCVKDGASVLIQNGYSSNFILQDCLGLLFLTLLWSCVGYYGLKREEKKGNAY